MLKYCDYDIVFQEIPDEITLAINLSRCPNGCVGCHSPQLMGDIGERLNEEVINSLIEKYGSSITCICFMGGDNSPKDINSLASYIHSTLPECKTGWYSGKTNISEDINLKNFEYIKIGAYKKEYGALKCKTTNQKLYKIDKNGNKEDITFRFWL